MRTDTISVPRHADAVQLAMQQGTRPSMESANRISSTLQGDKTQVKTAEALDNATNESTSADSGMISRSSEEAWGRAMQEFQRRGPAMNHRLMPQSLQSNY